MWIVKLVVCGVASLLALAMWATAKYAPAVEATVTAPRVNRKRARRAGCGCVEGHGGTVVCPEYDRLSAHYATSPSVVTERALSAHEAAAGL